MDDAAPIKVTLSEDGKYLLMRCEYAYNGLVKALPQRAWDGKLRAWKVKPARLNAMAIRDWRSHDYSITPQAQAMIDELIVPAAASDGTAFPDEIVAQMRVPPYKYQRALLDKLFGMKKSAIFMDTGTGKTKVGVDLVSAWGLRPVKPVRRVLVFSPLSIRGVWRKHVMEQAVGLHAVLSFNGATKTYERWLSTRDQFEGVSWLLVGIETPSGASAKTIDAIARFLQGVDPEECVCFVDESTKIKSHKARRTEAAIMIGRMAGHRAIFTGTPTSVGLVDLWAQYEFLDENIIGSGGYYPFKQRYAVMGGYEGKQIVGYQRVGEFTQLVAPFTVQARKSEVLTELPPKTYEQREITLSDAQRSLYRSIKSKRGSMETGESLVQNSLEKALRLREVVGGFLAVKDEETGRVVRHEPIAGDNPKLNELIDYIADTDEQTLIWCAFRSELALVANALRKVYGDQAVGELHGDVTEEARNKLVEDFQAKRVRFIVGNTATGGMGLTLTAATLMIFFSNTDSFIDRQQAEDRFHRIGQTLPVTVVDLVAVNTVDERIIEAHSNKLSLSEFIRKRIAAGAADDPFDPLDSNSSEEPS